MSTLANLRERYAPPSLLLVMTLTLLVLAAGLFLKGVCQVDAQGRLSSSYCYSDIRALFFARELDTGGFPYLSVQFEYPVGTGLVVGFTAAIASTAHGYFLLNVAVLTAAALVTVATLYRMTGGRALYYALAPSLLLWGFVNWDLLAIAIATAATAAVLSARDEKTGALLGLGAATKAFPILFLIPFGAERLRAGARRGLVVLVATCLIVILVLNVPFAIVSFDGWAEFFRINSQRGADFGSLWSAACQASGGWACPPIGVINVASSSLFFVSCACVWRAKSSREPDWPRWTFGLVVVVVFLLTNKVFSPQYSLWLLPWFALVLPDIRWFLAYEVVDIGVFVAHFGWQNRLSGLAGLPLWPLNTLSVVRGLLLIGIIAAFVLRPSPYNAFELRHGSEPPEGPLVSAR